MNVLFEIYKDKCIGNSEMFRKEITSKYKLTRNEINELYRDIVNYQIKTYGETLDGKYIRTIVNKEKTSAFARQRKYSRERVRGLR